MVATLSLSIVLLEMMRSKILENVEGDEKHTLSLGPNATFYSFVKSSIVIANDLQILLNNYLSVVYLFNYINTTRLP